MKAVWVAAALMCACRPGPEREASFPPRSLSWTGYVSIVSDTLERTSRVAASWSAPDVLWVGVKGPMNVTVLHALLLDDSLTVWFPSAGRWYVGSVSDASPDAAACGLTRASEVFSACLGRAPENGAPIAESLVCPSATLRVEGWQAHLGMRYPRRVRLTTADRTISITNRDLSIPIRAGRAPRLGIPSDAERVEHVEDLFR